MQIDFLHSILDLRDKIYPAINIETGIITTPPKNIHLLRRKNASSVHSLKDEDSGDINPTIIEITLGIHKNIIPVKTI